MRYLTAEIGDNVEPHLQGRKQPVNAAQVASL